MAGQLDSGSEGGTCCIKTYATAALLAAATSPSLPGDGRAATDTLPQPSTSTAQSQASAEEAAEGQRGIPLIAYLNDHFKSRRELPPAAHCIAPAAAAPGVCANFRIATVDHSQ